MGRQGGNKGKVKSYRVALLLRCRQQLCAGSPEREGVGGAGGGDLAAGGGCDGGGLIGRRGGAGLIGGCSQQHGLSTYLDVQYVQQIKAASYLLA